MNLCGSIMLLTATVVAIIGQAKAPNAPDLSPNPFPTCPPGLIRDNGFQAGPWATNFSIIGVL